MIELIGVTLYAILQRVEAPWIDDFADSVNGALRGLLRNLAEAKRADTSSGTEASEATQQALEALDREVRTDPAAAEQLLKPPLPSGTSATRIQQFADFLNYEGALIAALRRPVALPGFFNGTSCVTIVELRPLQAANGFSVMPEPSGTASDPADRVLSFTTGIHRPLIWLIKTADDMLRDELVQQFNGSAWPDSPNAIAIKKALDPPPLFGGSAERDATRARLKIEEPAQRLETISRDRITVNAYDAHKPGDWYAITDPDGILLFRAALAALFEADQKRQGLWPRALREKGAKQKG